MQNGIVQSYNAERGYGFIWCKSIVGNFAYLDKKEFEAGGCPPINTQVSFKVEIGSDGQAKATEVTQTWEKLREIRKQVEWYFSDASLSSDEFFYKRISEDKDGWLPVNLLLRCRKIQALKASEEMIYDALEDSHLIAEFLSPCETKNLHVRRRQPLPPFVGKEHRNREGKVVDKPEEKVANGDPFQTLARLQDQRRVQDTLGLKEVGNDTTIFRARESNGLSSTLHGSHGPIIARGYVRVIYGDHGPYIEFNEHQVNWQAWPHFFDKSHYGNLRFYDEYFTVKSNEEMERRWWEEGSNSKEGLLMLYAQTKSVDNQPWAPGSSTNAEKALRKARSSGYADYRAGFYYVAADSNLVVVEQKEDSSKTTGILVDPAIQSVLSHSNMVNGGQHDVQEDNICWRWMNGHCWKGDQCQWLHAVRETYDSAKAVSDSVPWPSKLAQGRWATTNGSPSKKGYPSL